MVDTALLGTIRSISMFSELSEKDAAGLAGVCDRVTIADGEYLFAKGDPAEHLFVVLSGELRISIPENNNVEVVVGTAATGAMVGEMGILQGTTRSANCSAVGETRVLRIKGGEFNWLVSSGHPAARTIIRKIRVETCARLRTIDDRVDAVFTESVQDEDGNETPVAKSGLRQLWQALLRRAES